MTITNAEHADAAAPTSPAERTPMLVEVSRPNERDWREAIDADPFALPEQSPEWMAAIVESSHARDASRAYRFDDGRSVVVPMVRTGVAGTGSVWSPPPAWGIGGLLGPEVDAAMVSQVVADLRSIRAPRVTVRIDARQQETWDAAMQPGDLRIPRRSHILDLHADPEVQFAELPTGTRAKIRKSERNGLQIEADRSGALIEAYYELFLKSVARWAEKQHEPLALALFRARRRDPIEKLRSMQRALGDRFLILVASVDGRPAAALIVLLGKTSRYTRGAMDIDLAGRTQANFALQWRAIQAACAHGSTRYHMGESGESAGIAQFKQSIGAQPFEHFEYRFERLPVTRTVGFARKGVKRVIGFSDT